ncbi:tubulin-specific chaperone B [Tetranychus urticae]|uniref:CAP-Gly domain-containing protein n=1 Tax=Tetranychus urticae TaxID=32264 RepID=T1KK18_TETUR|nr:tubulin-specific chaperone B [Tetranychus urticae]
MNIGTSGDNPTFLKFSITNSRDGKTWEKQYPLTITVEDLKMRLEMLSGIEINNMAVQYYADNENIGTLENDEMLIGSMMKPYIGAEENRLHIIDVRGKSGGTSDEFSNLEEVPKFEMPDDEYAKRDKSLRQYKMQNKLGRFSEGTTSEDGNSNDDHDWTLLKSLQVNDKVEITIKGKPVKKGVIAYLGKMHLKPGLWVGVIYDQPVGKHDGCIEGVRYFECEPGCGAFVRPSDTKVINE